MGEQKSEQVMEPKVAKAIAPIANYREKREDADSGEPAASPSNERTFGTTGSRASVPEVGGKGTLHRAPARPFFSIPWERNLCIGLLLALVTIGVYNPVTHAPFLNWDDAAYTVQNSHVTAGLHWSTVVWAFRSTEQGSWQPVTWLSHTLDCRLFGVNPAGPHAVNVFLHAINAVLLFVILVSATGFVWRSLAVAALFALHPINVESVAWIAQRKDVLSMLFFLLALGAYGWYARRPSVTRYLAVTIAFALGLMSKPQVITFPFALLLVDYWPLRRFGCAKSEVLPERQQAASLQQSSGGTSLWKLILEKVPWFAMSAASAVITIKAQAGASQLNLPFSLRLENAALSYFKYLEKAFWPANLAPIYPHPMYSIHGAAAALAVVGIIGVSILAVVYRRQRPFIVGWFWFLGTLVPMIGLVQFGNQAMADRFAYIPLLGIFLIICWSVAELMRKWHIPRLVPGMAVTVVVVSLGWALHRQESYWADNVKLWSHTVEITQNNYAAEDNLATAVLEEGKMEEAIAHFRRANTYEPNDALSTLNLAIYEHMQKHYQAAAEGYSKVLANTKVSRFLSAARLNRAYVRYTLKQYAEAKQDFEIALREQPDNADVYRGFGLLAQRDGNIQEAVKDYRRSLELKPSGVGFLLLAQALDLQGKHQEAEAARSMSHNPLFSSPADVALVKELLAD